MPTLVFVDAFRWELLTEMSPDGVKLTRWIPKCYAKEHFGCVKFGDNTVKSLLRFVCTEDEERVAAAASC